MSWGPHEWKTTLATRDLNGFRLVYRLVTTRLDSGLAFIHAWEEGLVYRLVTTRLDSGLAFIHAWEAYRNGKLVTYGSGRDMKHAKLRARRWVERYGETAKRGRKG